MQLTNHLTSNHPTHKFQSAYRPVHSTETALLRIVNDMLTASDANQVSILTILDLSAAFDTIYQSIMFSRLEQDFRVSGLAFGYSTHTYQTDLFVSASSNNFKLF